MSIFKVAKLYTKGPEQVVGQFKTITEAKDSILQQLKQDKTYNVNASYLLYDMGDLVDTFDQAHIPEPSPTDEGDSSSSGGKSSTQGFRPSPMQTTMRPPGVPSSSFKDEEDKDNKEK